MVLCRLRWDRPRWHAPFSGMLGGSVRAMKLPPAMRALLFMHIWNKNSERVRLCLEVGFGLV